MSDPPTVKGGITLLVATAGLVFNLASGGVLMRSGGGLNVRAALRHVLADALSSFGVILAALCIIAFGWQIADPLVSIAIAVMILLAAVSIVRESLDVLLEAAPAGIDVERMGQAMAGVDGVDRGARPARVDGHVRLRRGRRARHGGVERGAVPGAAPHG